MIATNIILTLFAFHTDIRLGLAVLAVVIWEYLSDRYAMKLLTEQLENEAKKTKD